MPIVTCCFIVSHKEIGAAKKLASWIGELGGVRKHEVVLCLTKCAQRFGGEDQIRPILEKAFGSVSVFVPHDEVEVGWPNANDDASSPNHMFKRVSLEMEYIRKRPWLWLEMDAVPVRSTWMDELDQEYERSVKPFMGVKLDFNGFKYMSGVAIYPANVTLSTDKLRNPPPQKSGKGQVPFDVAAGIDTTHPLKFHETQLIQYVLPNPGQYADWSVHKEEMKPGTVLYHRSQDLALIDHLRGKAPAQKIVELPPVEPLPPEETFEQAVNKHVSGLYRISRTQENREYIWKQLDELIGLPEVKHKRGKPMKKRKQMSPETRAKMVANLAKARAAKMKKVA